MTDLSAIIKMQNAITAESVLSVILQVESGAPTDVFARPRTRSRDVNALGCVMRLGTVDDIKRMLATLSKRYGDGLPSYLDTACSRDHESAPKETALEILVSNAPPQYLALAQTLVDYGGSVNVTASNGQPLLHFVVSHLHERQLDFMIRNGADLTIRNADGQTALELARATGQPAMATRLETAIADVAAQARDTAYHTRNAVLSKARFKR